MAASIAYRTAGQTYALSVANTQHAAVAIQDQTNDQVNFAAFLNSGTTQILVVVAPLPASGTANTPTVVFPSDGTPSGPVNAAQTFLLPASMQQPVVYAVPTGQGGFSVSAIGSAAGPSLMFVWPVGDQT